MLTAREICSLHARYTHSEVELRKCCLGQSAKSKIPYHLIKVIIHPRDPQGIETPLWNTTSPKTN